MMNDTNPKASVRVAVAGYHKDQNEIITQLKAMKFPSSDGTRHTELTDVANELSGPGNMPMLFEEPQNSEPVIIDPTEPFLDPTSKEFNVYEWAKMVMCVADKANVKFRRTSFAFKRLNVLGSGAASTFQTSVASVFMAPFRLHEYVTLGKRPKRKILHNLEGLTESGQMLLVLGRPGSGCSTFLKTVAGELNRLEVDCGSDVHYNGISFQHQETLT